MNDRYGHHIGDLFLRKTVERLRSSLRESDLLARVGGDEFVCISSGIQGPDEANEIGGRLLASLEWPLNLSEGLVLRCSASIGIWLCSSLETNVNASDSTEVSLRSSETRRFGRVEVV